MAVEQYLATGRRKTAVARVRLLPGGDGKFIINKRPIEAYFCREDLVQLAKQPMEIAGRIGQYDVFVNAHGGGTTGQAGAVLHGLARALVKADESLKQTIKQAGFLTRDPRMVERKKYGQKGARARFQFSKR